mmetsp:Transcript_35980/g.71266  ORF Transcript_35980/g.71266 Transcript_35980/m.71266 type:complete len:410 (+) Transcript_35980:116-1345(+)
MPLIMCFGKVRVALRVYENALKGLAPVVSEDDDNGEKDYGGINDDQDNDDIDTKEDDDSFDTKEDDDKVDKKEDDDGVDDEVDGDDVDNEVDDAIDDMKASVDDVNDEEDDSDVNEKEDDDGVDDDVDDEEDGDVLDDEEGGDDVNKNEDDDIDDEEDDDSVDSKEDDEGVDIKEDGKKEDYCKSEDTCKFQSTSLATNDAVSSSNNESDDDEGDKKEFEASDKTVERDASEKGMRSHQQKMGDFSIEHKKRNREPKLEEALLVSKFGRKQTKKTILDYPKGGCGSIRDKVVELKKSKTPKQSLKTGSNKEKEPTFKPVVNQRAKGKEKDLFSTDDFAAAGVATKKRSDWLPYSDVPDWVKSVMHEAMADPSRISNPANYRRRMQVGRITQQLNRMTDASQTLRSEHKD